MEYVTIATTGNAVSFGNMADTTAWRWYGSAGCSDSTRGIFAGQGGTGNTVEYVTIATTGNATDFGDLTRSGNAKPGACSDGTYGVFAGGGDNPPVNTIDYITIQTTGNATDFGDLTLIRDSTAACSGD